MADPRTVDRRGVDGPYQTFDIDNSTVTYDVDQDGGSAEVGRAVTLNSSDQIELADDGDFVLGRLEQVFEDDRARVKVHGEMGLPGGTGATLTRGKAIVGDTRTGPVKGYIREVNTAVAAELGVMRGFIDDPGDTDDVRVQL